MAQYTIVLDTELKSRMAEAGLGRLQSQADKLKKGMKSAMGGGAFAIRGIAAELSNLSQQLTILTLGITAGFGYATRELGNAAAKMEAFRASLTVLTGSADVATDLVKKLVDYAASTPLELEELIRGANTLTAFGVAAKDVIPILNDLGQAVVPLKTMGVDIEQGIRAFVQATVAARSGGAGMRITTFLPFGITPADVKKLGAQMGGDFGAAFLQLLRDRFSGVFAEMAGTLSQRLSNLRDIIFRALSNIGTPLLPQLKALTQALTQLINRVNQFAELHPEVIAAAFKIILDTARKTIQPVTDLFVNMALAIERNPEALKGVASAFTKLSMALGGLAIVAAINAQLFNMLATIVLLQLSLPKIAMSVGALIAPFINAGKAVTGLVADMRAISILPSIAGQQWGELQAIWGISVAAGELSGVMTELSASLGGLIAGIGKIAVVIGVVIQAFINWRDTLTLIGSVFRFVWDYISVGIEIFKSFMAVMDSLVSLIPGVTSVADLLYKAFALVANSIEICFRALDAYIEKLKEFVGLANDSEGATQRLDDAFTRFYKNQGMYGQYTTEADLRALEGTGQVAQQTATHVETLAESFARLRKESEESAKITTGVSHAMLEDKRAADRVSEGLAILSNLQEHTNEEWQKGMIAAEHFRKGAEALRPKLLDLGSAAADATEEFAGMTGATYSADAAFASLSADNALIQINAVTNAAIACQNALKPLAGVGPALAHDVTSYLLPDPVRRMLEEYGWDAVGGAVGTAEEEAKRKQFEDDMKAAFPNLFPETGGGGGGGGGGVTVPELTPYQEIMRNANEALTTYTAQLNIARELQRDTIDVERNRLSALESLLEDTEKQIILTPTDELKAFREHLVDLIRVQGAITTTATEDFCTTTTDLTGVVRKVTISMAGWYQDIEDVRKATVVMTEGIDLRAPTPYMVSHGEYVDLEGKWHPAPEGAEEGQRLKGEYVAGEWKDFPEEMSTVLVDFTENFASVLSRFLEDWGWSGGTKSTKDWLGLARQVGQPLFESWGGDIASMLGLAGSFAGPLGALVSGGVGFLANRIFGEEKPLEIKGPVDVNIVDISANAANFFTFKGFEGFTFTSRFRAVFESGLF